MTARSNTKEATSVVQHLSTEVHEDGEGSVRISVHAPSWFTQGAAQTHAIDVLRAFRAASGIRRRGPLRPLPTAGHPDGRRSYHFVETD